MKVNIPSEAIPKFTEEYFSLFTKTLDRPDIGDRGPEYRSLMGIPGGIKNPYFAEVGNTNLNIYMLHFL